MASFPGRFVGYDLALMTDGSMAEAVVDATGNAYARWLSSGTWGPWWHLSGTASAVSVTAATVSAVNTAYVGIVATGPNNTRQIVELTASGYSATTL